MGQSNFSRMGMQHVKGGPDPSLTDPNWDLPWLPPAGPNFLRMAQQMGDTESGFSKEQNKFIYGPILSKLYSEALRTPGFELPVEYRGELFQCSLIPGHVWGQYAELLAKGVYKPVDGPRPSTIMLVGKMPWLDEMEMLRNFVGEGGRILDESLCAARIRDFSEWYVTNICRFMPPMRQKTLKREWLEDCRPMFAQEMSIVAPDYMVVLGADAAKEVLQDNSIKIKQADGLVFDYTYMAGVNPETAVEKTAKVMVMLHPINAVKDASAQKTLSQSFYRFDRLRKGATWDKEDDVEHIPVRTLDELETLLLRAETDEEKNDDWIALDAEWQGESPAHPKSYLRTIQFAWRPKRAVAVVLRQAGGAPNFVEDPGHVEVFQALRAFFLGGEWRGHTFRKKRVVGHFLTADLQWLVPYGLDVTPCYRVPLHDLNLKNANKEQKQLYKGQRAKRIKAWERTRQEGGADTSAMIHAIEETAVYKLESLVMRFLPTVPRYDDALRKWLKAKKIDGDVIEGYGDVPDDILIPYGCYDADTTLRLMYIFDQMLECDYDGNCCREPYWETMIALPSLLEMMNTGMEIDTDRIVEMSGIFVAARDNMELKLREWAKWPELNPRSVQEVREFLYGVRLNGKRDENGAPVRIRPNGARSLKLIPLVNTEKPPKQWSKIIEDNEEHLHNPSTSKTTLSIMLHELEGERIEAVRMLRDHRFLDQAVKTVLRPPSSNDKGEWVTDEDGNMVFERGLASYRCPDGRVRTRLFPTLETRRWASAQPNLMNLSKTRDKDYARMLGDLYKYKLRSIFKAPEGKLLVEFDIIGAELLAMALMSGDPQMIEHAYRNQLPEDHPDHYDIHSNVTVLAFKLDCPPTKKGLEEIKKDYLRNIAKTVVFGVAYGRQAKAIAFTAREQGVNISIDEAQAVIDKLFELYPGLLPFFRLCQERVTSPGFLYNCWGALRRFPETKDRLTLGEFERQAMNFPIQSFVAGLMDRAFATLYDWREQNDAMDMFKFVLQIHDALMLEVPYEHVEFVCEDLVPWAMRDSVPIFPTDLDGIPNGTGPFYVGIEGGPMQRWGEKLSAAQGSAYGLKHAEHKREGVSISYFKA